MVERLNPDQFKGMLPEGVHGVPHGDRNRVFGSGPTQAPAPAPQAEHHDESFDFPGGDEGYDQWVEKRATEQAAGAQERQRIGAMKRAYKATGGTPKQPKQPKQVDPAVAAMRNAKKFRSLSSKARGRRR